MTKRDFELVAEAISAGEKWARDYPECSPEEVVSVISGTFIQLAKKEHPRFNTGTFENAARPLKMAELVESITAKLAESQS